MNNENIKIGSRIRALRENQKLSRESLAEDSNISTQFLSDIELGKKGMSVNTLKKICSALHVTPDYIIYGSDSYAAFDINPLIAVVDEEKQNEIKEILQKIIKLI